MDQEVAKTLGELELKLQELERELTTAGHREQPTGQPPGQPANSLQAPGRLVDEAVERDDDSDGLGGPPLYGGEELPAQAGATVERDWTAEARETAYGEIPTPPPIPPPSPVPPIPSPEPAPTPPPTTPPGPPPPTTPPSPGPPPPAPLPGTPPGMHRPSPPGVYPPSSPASYPPPGLYQSSYPPDPRHPAAVEESQSVDLAAMVSFRDKLASTMNALIEEYSRMLPPEAPEKRRSDT